LRIARRLALARLVSLTGGGAAYIALIAAVYDATGSAAWVSSTSPGAASGSPAIWRRPPSPRRWR
jgi:predicted heme/steroid binding protein